MSPQDQQVEVISGLPRIAIADWWESVIVPPKNICHLERSRSLVYERSCGVERPLFIKQLPGIGVPLRLRLLGMTVGKSIQLEKDVPQPQDFDEFGLTKTKPCCISVS